MQLPYFQSSMEALNLLQTKWRSIINPFMAQPILNGNVLTADLVIGKNPINHLLGRKQQGWIITDSNAVAAVYRSKPFNDKILELTSNAVVTISLWVY